MFSDNVFNGFQLHRGLQLAKVPCSWCGEEVPLPAGDFSGVCIECGTVMFRGSRRASSLASGSREADYIPAPAV